MTRTHTHTTTTTRPTAMFWQYEWATVQLLKNGERVYADVVRPALEQRVLFALRFLAHGIDETPAAEFHMLVDWDEHRRRVAVANTFVVPPGWTDEVSPQVRLGLKAFVAQVDRDGLAVRAVMSLIPGRELRGVRLPRSGARHRLAAGRIMCDEELRHLPELRVFFARANG